MIQTWQIHLYCFVFVCLCIASCNMLAFMIMTIRCLNLHNVTTKNVLCVWCSIEGASKHDAQFAQEKNPTSPTLGRLQKLNVYACALDMLLSLCFRTAVLESVRRWIPTLTSRITWILNTTRKSTQYPSGSLIICKDIGWPWAQNTSCVARAESLEVRWTLFHFLIRHMETLL